MKKSLLYDYQIKAVQQMKNGCILCGGVGSGKSRTAIYYYFTINGGKFTDNNYIRMNDPPDLYIITTARKRDTFEWDLELSYFLLAVNAEVNGYKNKVIIDSWNNISKYKDVTNAFFIFDEQRVIGRGVWVKSFLKIAKTNGWVLLSATPGDTWQDYIPVFIANGFYKNRSEFVREHVVYSRATKFPKVDRYLNTGKLIRLKNSILVNMDFRRKTISHHNYIYVDYDLLAYKDIMRRRWNIWNDTPIEGAGELCFSLRKITNTDESRKKAVLDILKNHPRAIIFYNFDYELEILKGLSYEHCVNVAQWNGHVHEPIPSTEHWVYLVQYTAGCEGWNCISTDTIIFYSQNYSYKVMVQASGRIDRLNTPYTDLYYYHIKSRSGIDIAITKALKAKKNFNENQFVHAK